MKHTLVSSPRTSIGEKREKSGAENEQDVESIVRSQEPSLHTDIDDEKADRIDPTPSHGEGALLLDDYESRDFLILSRLWYE